VALHFDVETIRKDFPALHQQVYGRPLVYMDNAATSQKPMSVIDAISNYYLTINSNVHRGVHYMSQQATDSFENAREHIRKYINARHTHEVIITKGATDSINLVAHSFGKKYLTPGSEMIISALEHHANIVPWQMVCEAQGAKLKVIPLTSEGILDLEAYDQLLTEKTKIVAITHISNALGVVNPIKKMIEMAHSKNIPVMIDGAQGIVHEVVDVQDLDCDFYCFSGHKFYGPMGVGVLYGKEHWLEEMPPYQTGGEMIKTVTFEKTTFNELPFKFETGTPNVADVIGFNTSIEYIDALGMKNIMDYEAELMNYANGRLCEIEGLTILAEKAPRIGVVSFLLEGIHPYDAGTIIDKYGIALRTGNHCAQPLMDMFSLTGSLRASLAFYNTKSEIDLLADAIMKTREMFA
jgi:cysteine desulfurase / selenocysteine lyase